VDQATIELLGLRGSLSKTSKASEKVVLFFTDGQPTLPYGPGFEADNVRAVLRAAGRANRASIRIHSFAIGPDALDGPVATVEMAQRTDGFFTPVRHPGDLMNVVEQVSFANIDEVKLSNLTTGQPAERFRSTADGSWAGFVRMEPGLNQVEVTARSSDGDEATRSFGVTLAKGVPGPPIPPELVVARNRLLEECLARARQGARAGGRPAQAPAARGGGGRGGAVAWRVPPAAIPSGCARLRLAARPRGLAAPAPALRAVTGLAALSPVGPAQVRRRRRPPGG
jgi:hypothetical protein